MPPRLNAETVQAVPEPPCRFVELALHTPNSLSEEQIGTWEVTCSALPHPFSLSFAFRNPDSVRAFYFPLRLLFAARPNHIQGKPARRLPKLPVQQCASNSTPLKKTSLSDTVSTRSPLGGKCTSLSTLFEIHTIAGVMLFVSSSTILICIIDLDRLFG